VITRGDPRQIREIIEQALARYSAEHGGGVPALNGYDEPYPTDYQVAGGQVTLYEGTWYQPALAHYEGDLGHFEAQLQGDHDLFFDVCTRVRGLPYWQYKRMSLSAEPDFTQPGRIFTTLYRTHHLRAISEFKQATLGELLNHLEQEGGQHYDYREAAFNLKRDFNFAFQSVSPVYPVSMGFTVDGSELSPYVFHAWPNWYDWIVVSGLNHLALHPATFERGREQFGEAYWNDHYMAQEKITRKMLYLCLTLAVMDVPSFRAFFQENRGAEIPSPVRTAAYTVGVLACECLGDAWRRMLYGYAYCERVTGQSWYQAFRTV